MDRDAQIKEIEHTLMPGKAVNRKIHVLHGLGGIGKTQLAIEYARRYREKYSAIIWVNGNSKDMVLQSLAAFARHSKLVHEAELASQGADHHSQDVNDNAQAALRWLARKRNCQWLMIFDNVDRDYHSDVEDPDAYELESYFPRADQGSILVTSRLSSLGDIGRSTQVLRLNIEQAVEILSYNSRLPPSTIGKLHMCCHASSHIFIYMLQVWRIL